MSPCFPSGSLGHICDLDADRSSPCFQDAAVAVGRRLDTSEDVDKYNLTDMCF
jgi:hypothetical protein